MVLIFGNDIWSLISNSSAAAPSCNC
jgi:hypothetical protein